MLAVAIFCLLRRKIFKQEFFYLSNEKNNCNLDYAFVFASWYIFGEML